MEFRRYFFVTPLVYTGATKRLTYHSDAPLEPGQVIKIPLGRRQVLGVVEQETSKPTFTTRSITGALEIPPIPRELCELANWLSVYYAASPSSTWSAFLPSGIDRKRRPAKSSRHTIPPNNQPAPPLTPQQQAALKQIETSPLQTQLLQGVTGSGKTRLYLELAGAALTNGKSVIILVPEITLTPQVVGQFEAAFGAAVLASHSKLTQAQRHLIWEQALKAATAQTPKVIVGPRSCLFMPVHHLGLIIIDESHEATYKQEQHPRYHAVTVAAWRARNTDARLILGSATPGLHELFLAKQGRIEHIILSERANGLPHPEAKIIDLRQKELFKSSKFITQEILDAISQTILEKRQVLLYVNRRGSASSQICGDCGFVNNCPSCALPLTFHADFMRLICHHCNFRALVPAVCPNCNATNLRLLGGGTKRIETEIMRLFPDAKIARLDRDSANLSHIQAVFRELRSGNLDILIGTQMIAKGLDIPAIDMVGVINADTMLHLPDYTAAERTYQLLNQVSGRAGRGDRPGKVYLQTFSPDHPAIVAAANNDYKSFATAELAARQTLTYPPYVYMLKLTLSTPERNSVVQQASQFATRLRHRTDIIVTGPAPAFLEQLNAKFTWILTVRSKQRRPLVEIASTLPSDQWTADLDPVNLL